MHTCHGSLAPVAPLLRLSTDSYPLKSASSGRAARQPRITLRGVYASRELRRSDLLRGWTLVSPAGKSRVPPGAFLRLVLRYAVLASEMGRGSPRAEGARYLVRTRSPVRFRPEALQMMALRCSTQSPLLKDLPGVAITLSGYRFGGGI